MSAIQPRRVRDAARRRWLQRPVRRHPRRRSASVVPMCPSCVNAAGFRPLRRSVRAGLNSTDLHGTKVLLDNREAHKLITMKFVVVLQYLEFEQRPHMT